MTAAPELSIILPAVHEGPNLEVLLPALRQVVERERIPAELLVVVVPHDLDTRAVAVRLGARIVVQSEPGYGGATLAGFAAARGNFVLTMDADLSHPAEVVAALWAERHGADITIASRFVAGGRAIRPTIRHRLSRPLSLIFRLCLDLPFHDLTCGFRLYRASVVRGKGYVARDLDILQEILLRADADGRTIQEIPFAVAWRRHGRSQTNFVRVGRAYFKTLPKLARWHRAVLRRRARSR